MDTFFAKAAKAALRFSQAGQGGRLGAGAFIGSDPMKYSYGADRIPNT